MVEDLRKSHRPCTSEKGADNLNELWIKTMITMPLPTVDHRNFQQFLLQGQWAIGGNQFAEFCGHPVRLILREMESL